ncbi:Derlin-2.2 [Wickerhamomyces ciferrii]|uniref:Derlin n=1 Tax=Wickerhamomyces ciferrii (strain ATCC 14091 / BCRC 22168 / CBS 111 / JCM 3599 / NBRC 0793 / NRRL Y-1031 F-60-10) TaxID=1206466 RepID=K0KSC1_WICCF|nr:Derlin-2.2 [Wickerhamomyces ciferrii]CCH44907.1 Derlin-2.2 [Wickerhamomyces ciferrii]
MERIPVNWMADIPLVTRLWTLSSLVTSILVDTKVIHLQDIMFSPRQIQQEPWRLITSFLYLGQFDINLIISLYLSIQYSRQLEESFNRTRDYLWFLGIGGIALIIYSTYVQNLFILGTYLNEVLNYVWSKKNPGIQMGFLGLIEFKAGYLSFLLILMSLLNKGAKWNPWIELPPFIIGHVIFYCEEVLETLIGFNPLSPPWSWGIWNWNNQNEPIQVPQQPTLNERQD